MQRCYYVTAAGRGGTRATEGVANPNRVYQAEDDAAAAARGAEGSQGGRFDVGTLDNIPEWATDVETRGHEIVPPAVVPQDDAAVYAMRYRPATQLGTLPPGVNILHWTRIPEDLQRAFPGHPISKRPFGEFVADRRLTAAELEHFQIDEIA